MENKFMNQQSIIAFLRSQGLNPTATKETSRLMISEKVIRCEDGDSLIVGMGNDFGKDDQVHLIVDAVHLCLQSNKKNLRLIWGKRIDKEEWAEVENAVSLMTKSIKIKLNISTEVDGKIVEFKTESFNEDQDGRIEHWMKDLSEVRSIPKFAQDLGTAIGKDLFKWYKSVTGTYWSGRVGGLEVCRVDRDIASEQGKLKVGKPGKYGNGPARKEFLAIIAKENIAKDPFLFSRPQLVKVASIIREIAEVRENGALNELQREHLLESQVLSEKVKIVAKQGILESVCKDHPFQFPTLWAPAAKPRFVDALMRLGDIPYVVELKEPSGTSPGQGYRHAITQAVLYREFVRRADMVHPWFRNKGLDPSSCRAVVAFPELPKDDRKQMLLRHHALVANAFGVEIAEIKGF